MVCYDIYESPMGTLYLSGRDGILTGLSFEACHGEYMHGQFSAAKEWLDSYFRGDSRKVDFPLKPEGTPFQKQVWKLLLEIPFGESRTYGDLAKDMARMMGKERMSPQAVGQAVGRNPIAVIIPCHRILGAGGSLTGYASGLDRKAWLLRHEGLIT